MPSRPAFTLAQKRVVRRQEVRVWLTTREHAALLVLARLAGKTSHSFAADLVAREVVGFEERHPGVIERELRKMLEAARKGEA